MEILTLLLKTLALRPYVFLFLAIALYCAHRLIGWQRAEQFFFITWVSALVCELSSTRTGIPFGWYHYTLSTKDQELYILNVPFMDSLSFTFLLFGSYCMALVFLLPTKMSPLPDSSAGWRPIGLSFEPSARNSWSALFLTVLFYAWIDMVIDPVALRGDRWFLGRIYYYAEPGVHFGVPLSNYVGWVVVGLIALSAYFALDRRLPETSPAGHGRNSVTGAVLLGCGLYYVVLIFNLTITFWIGEPLLGTVGILMYIPITVLLVLRLFGSIPAPIGK